LSHSFAATSDADVLHSPLVPDPVRMARDPATGVVHDLAPARIRSSQLHVESLLTEHGAGILGEMLISALAYQHDRELSFGFSPGSADSAVRKSI
jgi:phenazine biosynthesis protein phzE